jgi:hypothetical protein
MTEEIQEAQFTPAVAGAGGCTGDGTNGEDEEKADGGPDRPPQALPRRDSAAG